MARRLRIGVDVGGTNTDAAVMDGTRLLASSKQPTTADVESGVLASIGAVLASAGVGPSDIATVMIGTTHFTNALVQRRDLEPVGVLRIALPAASAAPPLIDWPADLLDIVGRDTVMVRGGYQYDGRVNAPLDEAGVAEAARAFRLRSINAVAVSALFAPVNDAMEQRAADIIRNEHPDAHVTLSSRIGRIGMIERENAGVMNASLARLAMRTVAGFEKALAASGLTAPLYISQNDGTLMSAGAVRDFPVLTFASGPTNSMRGAAYLSGLKDAIVVDIGGTTTDVGALKGGFPRESSINADVGGVRTNFRMPDILSIGLGGGSLVRCEGGRVRVGPDSVGYALVEKALVFGGDTLTATDIAVAAGYAEVGDRSRVKNLDAALVTAAVDEVHRTVESGVDRMKVSGEAATLILVGGGAALIDRPVAGASETLRDVNAGVANAIGAAVAMVGGEIDRVFSYETQGREAAIASAVAEAKSLAAAAGADPATINVTDLEELPLAYVPGGAVRLKVKAAGALSLQGSFE